MSSFMFQQLCTRGKGPQSPRINGWASFAAGLDLTMKKYLLLWPWIDIKFPVKNRSHSAKCTTNNWHGSWMTCTTTHSFQHIQQTSILPLLSSFTTQLLYLLLYLYTFKNMNWPAHHLSANTFEWAKQKYINPLKTKRRLLYLKIQFVPRSKHFSSWL
jgi:hypothetical protein